jgi:6-phospho-beta-glucosidase
VIFCAIRAGGLESRIVDEKVPLREGVLGQETVGPGGICFALRTVPELLEIARVVERRASAAWFVNFTNPAGLVTEAVRRVLGDRVVGICDSPAALCAGVAAALDRDPGGLRFDYAGLNHLGWLLRARDGSKDLLPELLEDDSRLGRVEEARMFGAERLRSLKMIPNEYLIYYESPQDIVSAFARAGATRAEVLLAIENDFYGREYDEPEDVADAWRRARDARFGSYMSEVWDAIDPSEQAADTVSPPAFADEGPGAAGYAAVAVDLVRAVLGNEPRDLVLNVPNEGRLSGLDEDAVVEVTCRVSSSGIVAIEGPDLPGPQAALVQEVKAVERMTIAAAKTRSRQTAVDALAAHPVVPSRAAAERILTGYESSFPTLARRFG